MVRVRGIDAAKAMPETTTLVWTSRLSLIL